MNIKIFINHIVLESGNFSPSQRRRLQAAIETELTNLLATNGVPHSLGFRGTICDLSISLSNISSTTHPTKLGQNVALAIYSKLSK